MCRVITVALALCALLLAPRAAPTPGHVPIGYVRVLRVSQPPYSPVAFRMAVKAPVGLHISVGYKIFDVEGHAVYHQIKTQITQPYPETSLTLRWNKRGYDGLAVPRGRTYVVVPYAGDLDDRDNDDAAGQLVRGRAFSFVLR